MSGHRRWSELSRVERCAVLVLGAVEVGLAGAAWTDLARRPAGAVNGGKKWWALAIAVNFVGPLAYFRWGRAQTPARSTANVLSGRRGPRPPTRTRRLAPRRRPG